MVPGVGWGRLEPGEVLLASVSSGGVFEEVKFMFQEVRSIRFDFIYHRLFKSLFACLYSHFDDHGVGGDLVISEPGRQQQLNGGLVIVRERHRQMAHLSRGQVRAGQGRAGQSRAEQSRAEQWREGTVEPAVHSHLLLIRLISLNPRPILTLLSSALFCLRQSILHFQGLSSEYKPDLPLTG